MNLNYNKNLALAKKGIYANQLLYYSKLCKSYQDLANYLKKHNTITTNYQIENKYAGPLSKIVASDDIDKTIEELSKELNYKNEPKYSLEEIKYLKSFAKSSRIFKTFQLGSKILDSASKVSGSDRKKITETFHKYMEDSNKDKTVRNFNELVSLHSPRYLGSRFYLMTIKSLEDIYKIDSSHVPIDLSIIKQNAKPQKYGAIITGYTSLIDKIKKIDNGKTKTQDFDYNNWNLSNNQSRKIRESESDKQKTQNSLSEKAYVIRSRFFKAHPKVLKRAAIIASSIALLFGGASLVIKENKAQNLNIDSTEYKQTVSNDTKKYINDIMKKLNMQKEALNPQFEDIKEIEQNIDLVLDYVVKDQVTTAFENYHKGYKVTDVKSWFDKTQQVYSSTQPSQNNYRNIDVYYTDEEGNSGKETIKDFRTDFLTQAPHLSTIFDIEEQIDLDSPLNKISDTTGKNYLTNANDIDQVLNHLIDQVEKIKHLAAFSMEHGHDIFSVYLKSTMPESNIANQQSHNYEEKE